MANKLHLDYAVSRDAEAPEARSSFKSFKCLQALPFLPIGDVIYGYKNVQRNAPPKFNTYMKYFEKWYLGEAKIIEGVERRKIPVFRIEQWNVHARVLADDPRTSNSLESSHKSFAVNIIDFNYFGIFD